LSFVAPAFLSITASRPKPATVVPTVISELCPAVTLLCTTLAVTPADVIDPVVSLVSAATSVTARAIPPIVPLA
jgi:hypothetical protein